MEGNGKRKVDISRNMTVLRISDGKDRFNLLWQFSFLFSAFQNSWRRRSVLSLFRICL